MFNPTEDRSWVTVIGYIALKLMLLQVLWCFKTTMHAALFERLTLSGHLHCSLIGYFVQSVKYWLLNWIVKYSVVFSFISYYTQFGHWIVKYSQNLRKEKLSIITNWRGSPYTGFATCWSQAAWRFIWTRLGYRCCCRVYKCCKWFKYISVYFLLQFEASLTCSSACFY